MSFIRKMVCRIFAKALVTLDPSGGKIYAKVFRERSDIRDKIDELLAGQAMFEDTFSRDQYEREVYFCLMGMVPELSPFSPMQWQAACRAAREKMQEGTLPLLSCYNSEDNERNIVTHFILKQYEYAPYVTVTEEDIFIDMGGYIGDTACWAAKCGAKRIYVFEPSEKSRSHIEVNKKICQADTIEVIPLGLSDYKGTVSFAVQSKPAAYQIVSEKDSKYKRIETIQSTTVDDWVEETGVNPTFIKMDIEGMELKALRGAEKTIRRLSPKLAISLYHNREDMLLIPRLIKEYNPAYKLWCKKSHPVYEFILFATVA